METEKNISCVRLPTHRERRKQSLRGGGTHRPSALVLCCAYNAGITEDGTIDWNGYPPTPAQLDTAARLVAKICIEVGIPLSSVYTHAEIADIDGADCMTTTRICVGICTGLAMKLRKARWYVRRWGAEWLAR